VGADEKPIIQLIREPNLLTSITAAICVLGLAATFTQLCRNNGHHRFTVITTHQGIIGEGEPVEEHSLVLNSF